MKRSIAIRGLCKRITSSEKGETNMGNSGKKDKSKKEKQKKALLNIKEKRRLKKEKKNT